MIRLDGKARKTFIAETKSNYLSKSYSSEVKHVWQKAKFTVVKLSSENALRDCKYNIPMCMGFPMKAKCLIVLLEYGLFTNVSKTSKLA